MFCGVFFFCVCVLKPSLEIKTFRWYFGKGFIKNGFGDHKSVFVPGFNTRAELVCT